MTSIAQRALVILGLLYLQGAHDAQAETLKADGTEVQWAHTNGVLGSGIQYDIKGPITIKAPEGMSVVLITHDTQGPDQTHDTDMNEIKDVEKYLQGVGDQGGKGLGGLFFMGSDGHVWDYSLFRFVAKAQLGAFSVEARRQKQIASLPIAPPKTLPANGSELRWAYTIGVRNSGIQYDFRPPIALKAPDGMTIRLITQRGQGDSDQIHDTDMNEIKDVEKYLQGVGAQDGKGLGGLFFMGGDGAPWDYWRLRFVAKAVKK